LKQRLEDLNIDQLANLYCETNDDLVLSGLCRQCERFALNKRSSPRFQKIPEDEARAICPDAVHDALQAFIRYKKQGTLHTAFCGIFARILMNEFFEWFRKNRRPPIPTEKLLAIVGPSLSRDPRSIMTTEERMRIIDECMARLSEKERQALQSLLEGLSDEFLRHLFSVKDARHHGHRKFKDCLKKKNFW
jgi:hypothetical protein